MNMSKKLSRGNDRMLAGVCSGIANYLDIDASVVRILTVVGCMFSGIFGIAMYFLVGILMDR
jgi:phage shock protein PspC (stress-responsive transcriptional regulator)